MFRVIGKEGGRTHLKGQLDGFDPVIERIKSAGETTPNSKVELLACSPSVITLHTHRRKFIHQPNSVGGEMAIHECNGLRTSKVAFEIHFPVRWR